MTFEEYKQQIAKNIEIISHINSKELPDLHWFLTIRKGIMQARLIHFLSEMYRTDNQTLYIKPKMWMMFKSIRHIASSGSHITKNHKIWHSTQIVFTALGLIYRHKPDQNDCDNRYMADSLRRAAVQNQRPTMYIGTPAYTAARLQEANKLAKKLRDSGMSTSNMNKVKVIRIWGQATANEIYQDGRNETAMQKEIIQVLVETAKELIKSQGYTTKDELLRETIKCLRKNVHPQEVKWLYNNMGNGILKEHDIRYHPPSNQVIEKYNLKNRRWIYTFNNT